MRSRPQRPVHALATSREGRCGTGGHAGGLSTVEVLQRLERDGPNDLPRPPRRPWWRVAAAQLTHLLALLLWVGAALALLAGMPALAVAIVVIVVLNAAFAFWQEHRAEVSTDRLRDLLPLTAVLVRNGVPTQVEARQVVVDDLALLAAGDRVPADIRLLEADVLGVDESIVTGESGPVQRHPGDVLLAGTFVLTGRARGVVLATGGATRVAGIAALTAARHPDPSPLTRELDRVVRVVAVTAGLTGAVLGTSALALGLSATSAFLLGIGVSVALVPEGLLPTVTLSLARGARLMARRQALVRRLDAVETLGSTTFVCTDKTGTLTQNRMSVVAVSTVRGTVEVHGTGYEPTAAVVGPPDAQLLARRAARAALACVTGRVRQGHAWEAVGDPMEAAIHCLALRFGLAPEGEPRRRPYSPELLTSAAADGEELAVLGAPEVVLARCRDRPAAVDDVLDELTRRGRRVLAVASREWRGAPDPAAETDLAYLGLLSLQDPPRPDVAAAVAACRAAGIRLAMVTGDHPATARAIAEEVGLLGPHGVVVEGRELPAEDAEVARLLDTADGAVVARVTPEDKLRIARALRHAGHVVAMTGDGVNDAPALREADVGVALGASGSDVAREAADLVLLDDHFGTIVAAMEQGRATYENVRRFLTYHLTDNVAELAPFALWALSGGAFPLAIGVLQVLALDIGTDILPALALGAEPARPGVMRRPRARHVVSRDLLVRAFVVLGLTEAAVSLGVYAAVLVGAGWRWGGTPAAATAAAASGSVFAAIVVGQLANAMACRSSTRPVWRLHPLGNRLLVWALLVEGLLLVAFLALPPLASLLGGAWPSWRGWLGAAACGGAVVLVDAGVKALRRRR
ncbi:MAG: cation-transporting P-type ATPase [Micrococcales bacterium]|nr:cation-transporting P-type ATPase [Micrococcales bacterium]